MKSLELKFERGRRFISVLLSIFLLTILCTLLSASVTAQDDDDPAPPPLKLITKDEQTRLEGQPELKERTKVAVELMRSCIDRAEKANTANDFDGIFRELGHFRALLDYTLAFLQKQDLHENRSLDNYKRLELSLRAAIPRVETIRREAPPKYEEYVHDFLKYIHDARTKAIDPMFSDTVLPTKK